MQEFPGITEKTLVDQAEAEKFREIIRSTDPDLIYILDADSGQLLYSNSTFKSFFPEEQLKNETFPETVINSADLEKWHSSIALLRGRNINSSEREICFTGKDNSCRNYRVINKFITGSNGKNYIIGSGKVIRKQERDLNKELSQVIFRTSGSAVAVFQPLIAEYGELEDFQILRANEEYLAITGITHAEDKLVSEIFPEPARQVVFQALKNAFELKENQYSVEEKLKNDEVHWLRISYLPADELVVVYYHDITDQKKRELKIYEHARFIERITKVSPDLILVYDYQLGRNVYINREVEDLLGLDEENLKRSSASFIEQHIHPDDLIQDQLYKNAIQNAEDSEVVQDLYRLRHSSGEWLWFLRRGVVFERDSNGEVTRFLEISQNITHQKEIELQLRESIRENAKANLILDTISDACFELDRNSRFVYVNRRSAEILHSSKPEMLGRNIWELFPTMKNTPCLKAVELALQKNIAYSEEYLSEACQTWISLRSVPTTTGVIITLTDISERIKSKLELHEKNMLLSDITGSTPDLIQIINTEGSIIYSNSNLNEHFCDGEKDNNLLSIDSVFKNVPPEDHQLLHELWNSLLTNITPEIKQAEWRWKDKSNKMLWLRSRGKVFKRDNEGFPAEFIFITQNITDQKEAEQKLIESEKFSLKGTLARTIAHEIRNPLTNIHLSADIIRKLKQEKANERRSIDSCLDIISRNTNNIDKLIKDLLSPASAEKEMKQWDLKEIVQSALEEINDRIYLRGIEVSFNFSGENKILADKEGLKIAFLNIFINAIEAMKEGCGKLSISLSKTEEITLLKIQDNGCGMTKEQVKKVFDPYFTLKQKGLGLGLSNVLHILNNHKAQVEVESEPGKGTVFSILFPQLVTAKG